MHSANTAMLSLERQDIVEAIDGGDGRGGRDIDGIARTVSRCLFQYPDHFRCMNEFFL